MVTKAKVGINRVPAHEEVITPENVKELGENIALFALKKLHAYHGTKQLDDLYYGLIRDIHYQNNPAYTFSGGYDYAQTAICFLCEHMGKTLGTVIQVKYRKTLKDVTVIHACTTMLGRWYYDGKQYSKFTTPIGRCDSEKIVEAFEEDDRDEQLGRVEEIIEGMQLTAKQTLTLDCYLQGMGITEITQVLHKGFTSIWRSRQQLQKKYLMYMGY